MRTPSLRGLRAASLRKRFDIRTSEIGWVKLFQEHIRDWRSQEYSCASLNHLLCFTLCPYCHSKLILTISNFLVRLCLSVSVHNFTVITTFSITQSSSSKEERKSSLFHTPPTIIQAAYISSISNFSLSAEMHISAILVSAWVWIQEENGFRFFIFSYISLKELRFLLRLIIILNSSKQGKQMAFLYSASSLFGHICHGCFVASMYIPSTD